LINQLGIFLFGMSAVLLVNDHRPGVRRWGPVLGLIAQPFWYYTAWTHEQWGIFASSFFYTASWARGFYNCWIRRETPRD
jgi:hypothetical protein